MAFCSRLKSQICKQLFRRSFCLPSRGRNVETNFPQSIKSFGDKLAVQDSFGCFSFLNLFYGSQVLTKHLQESTDQESLEGKKIAILAPNDATFAISLLSTWICDGTVVPLCPNHPKPELKYVLEDSKSCVIISSGKLKQMASDLSNDCGLTHISADECMTLPSHNAISKEVHSTRNNNLNKPSLILYTSGTTGRPKGVIHSHASILASINKMVSTWEWKSEDVILHVLPLHHTHGLINCLLCPLSVGATVKMMPKFNPELVWQMLLDENCGYPVNIFMAVPTIYAKLIDYFDKSKLSIDVTRERCQRIRLMVSGSSALPISLYKRWQEITGHSLLERYGMTEFGMGLTNPLHGKKTPGSVGLPFPGVRAKVVQTDSDGKHLKTIMEASDCGITIHVDDETNDGELLIQSDSMFQEYLNNQKETKRSFVDGWFKTGDTAQFKEGGFCILGRTSVDIIKSGGFKISALNIERVLLEHSAILEVAVLGVPDKTYGEQIVALISTSEKVEDEDLIEWCKKHLPPYQIPKVFKVLDEIPKNVMGKVNKKTLSKMFP